MNPKSIAVASVLLLSCLALPSIVAAQTVTTDRLDYYPGDIVTVTGTGWWPGETVSLRFEQYPTLHEPFVHTTIADSTGAIRSLDFVVQDADLGTSFDLMATGLSSGLTAYTYFTDSPKVGSVAVSAQTGTGCSITNSTATYTITVERGTGSGSSGSFTADLSITTALPAGVTAVFTPDPVSFNPGGDTRTATLTLTSTGGVTPPGTTAFTVQASTSASDFATGTGSLLVTQPPAISCPTSFTLNSDPGQCGALATFSATASGSPTPTVTYSKSPGTLFPVGVTTVTATATNSCGSVSCNFTVTVLDQEKPAISVANVAVSTDPGLCTATIVALGATATDNCGVQSLVGLRSDAAALTAPFPKGVTTVTWTAIDLHGNTQTASQTVTVSDTENPTVTAPAALDLTTGSAATSCDLFVSDATLGSASSADNCGVTVVRTGVPAGNLFPVGLTTISYTATDPSGNSATATQTVLVVDTTKPVITTTNLARSTASGTCTATIDLGTTAADNCGVQSLVGTRGDGAAIGDAYPVGATTISWLATDIHGNTSTATQTVTVSDDELPVITTAALSVSTDAGLCGATVASLGTTALDNCGVQTLVGVRGDGAALADPFPTGTTTITWTATDIHGNVAGATQHVLVADPELPTITAPAALNLTTGPDATLCGVTVTDAALGTATASDNCSVTVTRTGVPASNFFPVGTTTITYIATDPAGNSATATQMITVVDDTPPVIVMPDKELTTDPGSCSATIQSYGMATQENCGVQSSVGTRGDGLTLGDPYPLGSTTINWVITDIHGNTGTDTQVITVVDHELPVIAPPPAVNASTGPTATTCGVVVTDAQLGTPTASDNCAFAVSRSGVPAGNLFPVGPTTITYTARDSSGNSAVATQTVTVIDNTPPTLTTPAAVTLSTGPTATQCGLVVTDATLGTATATDNCSATVVRTGVPSGNLFPAGPTTITYTATDPSGNPTTGTQVVTILDGTPPAITTAAITVSTNPGVCSATIDSLHTSATDNCTAAPTLVGVRGDGQPLSSAYPKGTTTITWTATDAAGNSKTATQTITVTNGIPVATITGPPSGFLVAVGTPVTFTGTFTDDAGDLHTATWTIDALTTAGVVDESAHTVTATRTFTTAGVFLIKLTVTDQCGTNGVATQVDGLDAMIVVYDPNAGFVTGGGWIQSPAGAYTANPTLTGMANFGFVAKYKRGMTSTTPVLTGETEFQFKAGDLNFHSSSYEWLTVAGARAQFKGAGTVNGAGSYGFLLSATDGQTNGGGGKDKFRIKIVNKATGLTVYDNQLGAPDSAGAVTVLGGGSIAIQTQGGTLSASEPARSDEADGAALAAPGTTALFQNQPNPFNPQTMLRFTLARPGQVSLRVFNVRGALVKTLAEGAFAEGTHFVRWNGTNEQGGRAPSGVYYARLNTSDGETRRVRMILLK